MRKRHLTPLILEALADTPVVFLQGPRQSGKTTLVRSLAAQGYEAEYRTLDDAAVLAAARSDPDGFVDALPERIILDEVQRAPDLFRAIKRRVDARRRPGRFLLTGSAHALVLPRVSESLAGRMEVLRLWPFSQGEIEGRREGFVDACFSSSFKMGPFQGSSWTALVGRIVRGGFPEVLDRPDPARRSAWFGSYTTTMLERDVRDLSNVHHPHELLLLLRLIAARSSGVLNLTAIARDARMPLSTAQRHWKLLETVFFVLTLPAWSGNLRARLAKAPKILVPDTGLLCHLTGLEEDRLKSDELMAGAALETFVAAELVKQVSWSRTRPRLFHYRTQKQQEVDVVMEDSQGRLVGLEVKKTASPSIGDFKGLRHLQEITGKRFLRGILLYTGEESAAFGHDLYAVPISSLWQT